MPNKDSDPQTFVEMVLALIEDRFPWLGSEDEASGADTVQELSHLHGDLIRKLNQSRRKKPAAAR
jgi:hypothetical protein